MFSRSLKLCRTAIRNIDPLVHRISFIVTCLASSTSYDERMKSNTEIGSCCGLYIFRHTVDSLRRDFTDDTVLQHK
jgi:hypothetical protein